MKKYNIDNYIKWKKDMAFVISRLPEINGDYTILDRDQTIVCFLPLVENIARKFSTAQVASGVMTIMDLIQEGNSNEIRRNFGKDKKMVEMFFNSIFLSIDEKPKNGENMIFQIPDTSEPYNMDLLNVYLKSLMKKHLTIKEYEVLRLSYGLDCDKHTAKEIADILSIEGSSSYVRVSQLKKQAVERLVENVDHSQVIDYL